MFEGLERDFPPHESRPAQAPKALEGIRVVDFTHFLAGPLGTMIACRAVIGDQPAGPAASRARR